MFAFLLGTSLGRLILAGLVCVALCIGCWIAGDVHGHRIGKAAGDTEVATLQAKYATAYAQAIDAARTAQARADALALQQAQAREKDAQQRAQEAAGIASDAHARLLAAQRKLDEVSRHDATVDAWRKQSLPAGVVGVLDAH